MGEQPYRWFCKPGDRREAFKLAMRTYPRGKVRPRWESMYANRVAIEDPWWSWFDLSDLHPVLRGRAAVDSRRNREWNRRVLTLLQQAELIRLETPVNVPRPSEFLHPIGVRILDINGSPDDWERAWQTVRDAGRTQAAEDHEALLDLVDGADCFGRVLSSAFSRAGVIPVANCSGCPWCRQNQNPPRRDESRIIGCGAKGVHGYRGDIASATGGGNVVAVVAERGSPDAIRQLLDWAGPERSLVATYEGSLVAV